MDDIDFTLSLHKHGWSSGYWIIDCKVYAFSITHIFNDPYSETLNALCSLIKGNNSSFFWLNEPYGIKTEFILNKLTTNVTVNIYDIQSEIYAPSHDVVMEKIISFSISIKDLSILFYYQFRKICTLLEDKEYANKKTENFPFQEFHQFERLVKEQRYI